MGVVSMSIIQPVFEIAPDIEAGLLSGTYRRVGGVIYYAAGTGKTGIVEHLKETIAPAETTKSVLSKVVDFFSTSKGKIIIAVGICLVTIGAGSWLRRNAWKKRQMEIVECVENFNHSFGTYLDAISNGDLDLSTIDSLMESLEVMEDTHDNGIITIDFSSKQFQALAKLICDYTEKLAEANSSEVMKPSISVSTESLFIDMRQCLEFQRQIFRKAA